MGDSVGGGFAVSSGLPYLRGVMAENSEKSKRFAAGGVQAGGSGEVALGEAGLGVEESGRRAESGEMQDSMNGTGDAGTEQRQRQVLRASGVSIAGRPIEWRLHDALGLPIPSEELYQPRFRERCETCGQRLICNGCSDCGRCA